MPAKTTSLSGNRLLDVLPGSDRRRMVALCILVDLRLAAVLSTPGSPIRYVYFPLGGFVSVVSPAAASPAVEVAMVGSEGMVGLSVGLGSTVAQERSQVRGAGTALRIGVAPFLRQLSASVALRKTMNRYVLVRMAQLAQAVACNHFHLVESRLARWLLATRDRTASNAFGATQAYLSQMLGVRRAGVSEAARALRRSGLIEYSRGRLCVLDPHGLEAVACGCYRIDLATYVRELGASSRRGTAKRRSS
jgi:CRP-like cAMP-binding protein